MYNDKTILITGGTGSWGNEMVKQLFENYNPKEVRIYSRGEHKQVKMSAKYKGNDKIRFIIGDVRDKNILNLAMKGVDYVFHLAALKHVPICEDNTWEAVLTNIYGAQNVIECAIENNVKKLIDISTDKAVDPFNHYGVTKACAEKMIVNASFNYQSDTKFVCIRGGNVLGTNGSVIPLFKHQIQTENHITITDPKMTRYLMSTKEAIQLVFEAVERSIGGEIFVMKMPATSVLNIAKSLIKLFGDNNTESKIIGARPGEKLDEVLVSKNEAPFTKIINDKYFVILPQKRNNSLLELYKNYPNIKSDEFNSRNADQLNVKDLIKTLKNEKWLMGNI
jgi:UDP-N-acetylglucosamine 4,6-dehydratase/5-epimerase